MTPVYIDGCYTVLHEAAGRRGVVICGSLGDEDLNLYRSQVLLADRLARAGFPTLRVSYYGTGDSAGSDGEPDRLGAWCASIIASAHWLRTTHAVTRITLCGVRIGAALAALAASETEDVDSLALLAPVTTGRQFLREKILAAHTNADIWQSHHPIDEGAWFEAHGVRLDHPSRDALSGLDVRKLRLPHVTRVLLLDQPSKPNSQLVTALQDQGVEVAQHPLDGRERWLRDSHESDPPHTAFEQVVEWLGEAGHANHVAVPAAAQSLDLGALHESPVRFGRADALAGILSLPAHHDADLPIVLIPNTGANPHYGNSRGTVTLARWLAEQGIASLRMDGHGIGDAVPATGERGGPYTEQGNADISAGVDYLVARFRVPIVVLGMCSGAYHAFQAALNDHRINGLILVNLQKFVWQGDESLTVVQRTTFRTTGFYLRNLANPAMWRRLCQGQINVSGITRALAIRAARQLAAAADPAIAAVNGETNVGMVRRQLGELSQRSVRILYVLSGNDPGLDEISEYFGVRGWRLRRKPNVTFLTINRADHTFSAHWARERLKQAIQPFLRQNFRTVPQMDAVAERPHDEEASPRGTARARRLIDSAPTAA
jgi:alpha/beta superfamily hydrolase